MDRIFVYETNLATAGCLPLSRGLIHVYDVHTQNMSETAWPIKDKIYVQQPYEVGTKSNINGPGHINKIAAMHINCKKPLKIFFSRTRMSMIFFLKICMIQGIEP